MSMQLLVSTSPGELIDKITILEIKAEKIRDDAKLRNVRAELDVLLEALNAHVPTSPQIKLLRADLKKVNLELWVIEDDIRDCEREKNFGAKFIALARAVYFTNDRRAAIKKEINLLTGSTIVEEKSYMPY